MRIGEKEKTATYPRRTVWVPPPAGKTPDVLPAEGWPVRKETEGVPAPAWPVPATIESPRR
jgi:hypothetical protein